jgi:hypothetical protein
MIRPPDVSIVTREEECYDGRVPWNASQKKMSLQQAENRKKRIKKEAAFIVLLMRSSTVTKPRASAGVYARASHTLCTHIFLVVSELERL